MRNTKLKRVLSIALVLALVLTTFAGCGGSGGTSGGGGETGETITLRLSSDAPLEHIASELNKTACEEVEKRTEGRVKIDYYPASQLGGYDTVMEEVMRGTIDMAQISFATSVDQRLSTFNTPALTTGWEEAAYMYGPDSFMTKTYQDLCNEFGMEFLGWVLEGYMGLGMVKTPTDAKVPGVKKNVQIRVWGSPVCIDTMSDLGFTTVTIPYAEAPTAIQTGVVDGWIGGTPNMNYAWVGEIIKSFYVNYLYAETTAYMISEKTIGKLSQEDADIVREVFAEASQNSFAKAEENEELYLKKLADDYGVSIERFTEEEIQAQADFVRNTTWPKLEATISKDILAGLKEDLDKYNASKK